MIAPARLDYNAVLVDRFDLSETLGIFRVRPDDGLPAGPWFAPGQYVTLGLNNEQDPTLGAVERPMSIASSPEERRWVEFYVRRVDHPTSRNPLTRLLWTLRSGDRLCVRLRPKGRFTIADSVGSDDRRLHVLVSAGTGLAPFVSMVRSAAQTEPSRLARVAVLHGASYPVELGYRDELDGLAAAQGLVYLPTVSRPAEAPDWSGVTGRVEDFFLAERLEATGQALGVPALDPAQVAVFVCGLQGTIEQVLARLIPRGFVPGARRMRQELGIADERPASLFWEHYDRSPTLPATATIPPR